MHELEAIIHAADDAINREDLDAVMAFYAEDATLVVRPGLNATGKDQIRKAFTAIAEHFNHSLHVTQDKLVVIEGGATALVLGKAELRAKDPSGAQVLIAREATYVFTRDGSGAWRCAVDNSYGTGLLMA
ncbi:nuclear transport factor 2 family protein [Geothrix sp. 21YS21S-2]|uniref:YybH family protein n=1 Tax=Geothrix sp. 21YS21S-2 TaxID=3068893 RepID=UPI0027B9FC33|nr:nuclear transport factor 2 family protein [Geothrix sp. 21YS21S-2]